MLVILSGALKGRSRRNPDAIHPTHTARTFLLTNPSGAPFIAQSLRAMSGNIRRPPAKRSPKHRHPAHRKERDERAIRQIIRVSLV